MRGYTLSSIRQAKYERAEAYILAHPDETKAQQAAATHVSTTLIAQVRADLILRGLLAPPRKAPPPQAREFLPAVIPKQASGLLDHNAMAALSGIVDAAEDLDTLSDEEIQRKLLRQCVSFALNTNLHPDTRMSASQMWAKLRDLAKSRTLGPGAPVTFEEAVERLRDIMAACGPKITMAAINAAFDVKEDAPDAGKLPPDDAKAQPGAPGTAQP